MPASRHQAVTTRYPRFRRHSPTLAHEGGAVALPFCRHTSPLSPVFAGCRHRTEPAVSPPVTWANSTVTYPHASPVERSRSDFCRRFDPYTAHGGEIPRGGLSWSTPLLGQAHLRVALARHGVSGLRRGKRRGTKVLRRVRGPAGYRLPKVRFSEPTHRPVLWGVRSCFAASGF
jgi:hypothetical protein